MPAELITYYGDYVNNYKNPPDGQICVYSFAYFLLFPSVSAWAPQFSGCYRPLYYSNTSSVGTENKRATSLRPVTLAVSHNAPAAAERNYDAGIGILIVGVTI